MIRIDFDDVLPQLSSWICQTRWYRGSGATKITCCASNILPATHEQSVTGVHILDIDGVVYSVPLTYQLHPSNEDGCIGQVVGRDPYGHEAEVDIFDASDHSRGKADLYGMIRGNQKAEIGPRIWIDNAGMPLTLRTVVARDICSLAHPISADKLTSEQSNTSIIYRFDHHDAHQPAGIMGKLFRVVSSGHNPDVELQQALDTAGSLSVPRQYGSVAGSWDDTGSYDLFVAQEFLAGAFDAWQVILRELTTHGPVMSSGQRERITALGTLTQNIHHQLNNAFGTSVIQPSDVVPSWRKRAKQAFHYAPELTQYAVKIDQIYDDVARLPWPAGQRIHGDYHLGQVLDVPNRGWVALDFEGEPLRPLDQRRAADLALRDVAGMIRSFDYAGGACSRDGADPVACQNWVREATEAFLTGYGDLDESEKLLLKALIIDKALYEVSYEALSRPDWIDIPIGGVKNALLFQT